MGQYYGIIIKRPDGKINYNLRRIEGCDYQMAKLMEHSYMQNDTILAIVNQIYKEKCRLIWCGDYAEADEIDEVSNGEASYDNLWDGEDHKKFKSNEISEPFTKYDGDEFDYSGKFLVNHTKKVYIPFDEYIKKSTDKDGWCISPISLRTAIGNGRGGGDYDGENVDKVGSWAWDEISIEDKNPGDGFEKSPIFFFEEY